MQRTTAVRDIKRQAGGRRNQMHDFYAALAHSAR